MNLSNEAVPVNDESRPEPGENLAERLDLSSLGGEWRNTNTETRGIAQIDIRAEDAGLRVRVYGAGVAGVNDWGERSVTAYAYRVTGDIVAGFESTWDFGSQEALVTAIHNRGVLVIHTYHRFKDGDGRSNFISKEFFHQ